MELTADEGRALEARGGGVCGRTAIEAELTQLDAARQRADIARHKALLEGIAGHPADCSTCPLGRRHPAMVAILRKPGCEHPVDFARWPMTVAGPVVRFRSPRVSAVGSLTWRELASFPETGHAIPAGDPLDRIEEAQVATAAVAVPERAQSGTGDS